MKTLIIATFCLAMMVHQASGQGAQGAQITQRARELRDQNNARQGVQQSAPQAAQPAAQPQKPVAPSPAQIQQQNINRIKNDIAAILAGEFSEEKALKLGTNIMNAARGPRKPSSDAINKLAKSIATSLAGRTLGAPEQLRLAEDIEALVNGAGLSKLQSTAYASDIQSILQKAGVSGADAIGATDDAKAITAEFRR